MRSKRRVSRAGAVSGGSLFSRGQIHHLLTSPTYRGLTRHREKCFPGQNPAIVPEELWARVQEKLAAQSARRRGADGSEGGGADVAGRDGTSQTPLLGKIRDEADDPLCCGAPALAERCVSFGRKKFPGAPFLTVPGV